MNVIGAIAAGFRRVMRARRMAVSLWFVSFLVALPAAWAMGALLKESIGASLVHEKLRDGFDLDWYWLFVEEGSGIAASFSPGIVGAGAFFENLEGWISGTLFGGFPGLVALGVLYSLLWAFLLGGVLERLARPERALTITEFVRAGGTYFQRFVLLAILTAVPYLLIYICSRWLYDRLEFLTRDVTHEWTIFALSLLVLAVTALLLVLVHIAGDYAKISTVVEGRRNMLQALGRGFRFLFSHPVRTLGIYCALALLWVAILLVYTYIAPGSGQSTLIGVVFAFLAGQLVLFSRLVVRLALLGGQTALFQDLTGMDPR